MRWTSPPFGIEPPMSLRHVLAALVSLEIGCGGADDPGAEPGDSGSTMVPDVLPDTQVVIHQQPHDFPVAGYEHGWGSCRPRAWKSSRAHQGDADFPEVGGAADVAPLADGRLFLMNAKGTGQASLYDPVSDEFSAIPPGTDLVHAPPLVPDGPYASGVTTLADGRIFISGGENPDYAALIAAGVVDPTTWEYREVARMLSPRTQHHAFTLSNGKVMVFGGKTGDYAPDTVADIYDPVSDTWQVSPTPPALLRVDWGVTRSIWQLNDGRLLTVGAGPAACGRAFVYRPETDEWSETAPLPYPLDPGGGVVLNDGRLMVFGGDACPYSGSPSHWYDTYFFDPSTDHWTAGPAMPHAAGPAHVVPLRDCNSALVFGFGAPRELVWEFPPLLFDATRNVWVVTPLPEVRQRSEINPAHMSSAPLCCSSNLHETCAA